MDDREELAALRRMAELEAKASGQQAAPSEPEKEPSAIVDMARSIPGGLAQGVASTLGAARDINDIGNEVIRWGANKVSPGAGDKIIEWGKNHPGVGTALTGLEAPGSKTINEAISKPFGGYYKPQTVPGEYAQTIASFAPAALAPGSAAARAGRVVIPGTASETAGQFTKGSPLEPYARTAGALAGGIGAGMLEGAMALKPPSVDDLRARANQIYTAAKNSGVNIKPEAYDNLVDDIAASVKEAGTHPKLHPKVDGVLDSLKEVKGSELSLGDLERLRRVANGAAKSIEPDERRVAGIILDKIDDFMDGLDSAKVSSGDPAVGATLSDARGLWSKMRKSETIDDLVERAKTRATTANGNYAAALRGEFQALARNKKAMRGFSEAERKAIDRVAKVGATTGTLSALGVLRPRGLIGWGELAAGVAHPEAALPMMGAAAVGQGAQMGANALTARNARLASELMRAGPNTTNAAATALPRQLLLSTLLSQSAH